MYEKTNRPTKISHSTEISVDNRTEGSCKNNHAVYTHIGRGPDRVFTISYYLLYTNHTTAAAKIHLLSMSANQDKFVSAHTRCPTTIS